ncbi:hypothetical protein [uncultured Ilyobacter sp.]|uniref:hypothetical protein n=1 Tax=uncultured Ilyobacter sp. TaxID=544433 RepID=UPI0029C0B444|nr:hypothetical protein [uncultured Ilyobacter sp.]
MEDCPKKNIYLTEKDNEIAKFTLKNMSYLKREILKKHPLADFKNFISYMNLLSKFYQEESL